MSIILNRYTKSIVAVRSEARLSGGVRVDKLAKELAIGEIFTTLNFAGKKDSEKLAVVGFTKNAVLACSVNGSPKVSLISKEISIKRKSWYNKKSGATLRKIKESIQFLYETKKREDHLLFVTITTKQHDSGISDVECNRRFGLWTRNRKDFLYVAVLERQRVTADIHYHCIIRCSAMFDISAEVRKLAALYNVSYHPALFDVKRVSSIPALQNYLRKYFSKQGVKECACRSKCKCKAPYSSLFFCRTFFRSKRLSNDLKRFSSAFRIEVPEEALNGHKERFIELFKADYFTVYKYDVYLWNVAIQWRRNNLKAEALANIKMGGLSETETQNKKL